MKPSIRQGQLPTMQPHTHVNACIFQLWVLCVIVLLLSLLSIHVASLGLVSAPSALPFHNLQDPCWGMAQNHNLQYRMYCLLTFLV